jgi:hypothetical protein
MASGTPATIRPTARAASVTPAAGKVWVVQNRKWTLMGRVLQREDRDGGGQERDDR